MFQKCHWHTDLPKWSPWRVPWGHDTLREQHVPRQHKIEVALPFSPAAGWSPSLIEAQKTIGLKSNAFLVWFPILIRTKRKMESFAELGGFGVRGWNAVFLKPYYICVIIMSYSETERGVRGRSCTNWTCALRKRQFHETHDQTAWYPESGRAGQPELQQGRERKQPVCGDNFCEITLDFCF